MRTPEAGTEHTVERTFTEDDVRAFADVSGDDQSRHVEADAAGRRLVHGLLTATLSTEIGGALGVLAREMAFEFVRPVYTGETVTCTWTTERVAEREDRYDLAASVVCETEESEVVLRGDVEGLVWKDGYGDV